MAYIIKLSDFEDLEYSIPKSNTINFQTYIEKYEPVILKQLLGVNLYTLMTAAPTEERFIDLINGVVFDYMDIKVEYKGLRGLIANYVFLKYLELTSLVLTRNGGVVIESENAVNVGNSGLMTSHSVKVINYFNECVEYLSYFDDIFPEFRLPASTPKLYHYL